MSHSHQGHIIITIIFIITHIQSGKPFRTHFGEELSPCKTSIQTWSQSSSYHCTFFNYICLGESLSPRAYHYHDHFLSLPTLNLVNPLECTLVRNSREKILHGIVWIPWRIFRVEYWNELPWTISSFSTADRRIIFLDIVHGVFPWIPWNVSMDCGFGPCFPWTVSTDEMSSSVHGVHGKLSVWSIETLFHGKFPCFPLQASFPFNG